MIVKEKTHWPVKGYVRRHTLADTGVAGRAKARLPALRDNAGMPLVDQRLQQVFREVFEDDRLALSDGLSPETMREWDSLAHIKLIMGCEEEFGVKFTLEETVDSNSVAKLKSVLASKGVAR